MEIEKDILSQNDRYFRRTTDTDPKVADAGIPRPISNPVSTALYGYRSLKQGSKSYSVLNVSRFLFIFPLVVADYSPSVSEERAKLFQQALQSTNSPAKAIQALFHTVMADGFYRYLPYYDVPSNYSVNYEKSALQPVRKVGLVVVLTALVLHVICVSIIAIFISGILCPSMPPLYASINNIWQAHAQLLSPEIESILRDPTTTKQSNREVKKRIRQENEVDEGKHSVFVSTLGAENEDGAVRLRKQILPRRAAADERME